MKTDADIKRDVEAELAWDPAVRARSIGVAVRQGVVTPSGHLETCSEKWAVEKALRRVQGVKAIALERDDLKGVVGVSNEVTLRSRPAPTDVWHERDAAEGAARAAPGVRRVINELRIG